MYHFQAGFVCDLSMASEEASGQAPSSRPFVKLTFNGKRLYSTPTKSNYMENEEGSNDERKEVDSSAQGAAQDIQETAFEAIEKLNLTDETFERSVDSFQKQAEASAASKTDEIEYFKKTAERHFETEAELPHRVCFAYNECMLNHAAGAFEGPESKRCRSSYHKLYFKKVFFYWKPFP